MWTVSTTDHCLQMREIHRIDGGVETCWHPVEATMYKEARRLAWHGHLHEALKAAEDARVANYGDARGVEFRIVTITKSVTSAFPEAITADAVT